MNQNIHITAAILAAGAGERMGRSKPLLPLGDHTFLEHILTTLQTAGITRPLVVLGHASEEVQQQVDLTDAEIVMNENWQQGQLSSLQAALRAMEETETAGLLVCLVDHPFFSPDLVRQLLQAFGETSAPVVIPSHNHRRGHPVLFSAGLFPELLRIPADQGARPVVEAHTRDIVYVETDEEGVLWDIDTPERYEQAITRFG